MISFLRKYRHKLLSENKLRKYLVYALGEIILVVIGILIAVSINNWQQQTILKNKEQVYLKGLKEEFNTSKNKLDELIEANRRNYQGSKTILEYISNTGQLPTEKQFSELLFRSFSFDIAFNANNSLLNEMINSGSLKDISNNQLRVLLTNWETTIKNVSGQEEKLAKQREKVLDMFLTDKNSIRTIFEQINLNSSMNLPKSKKNISNLNLLNSLEFENNILMFFLTSTAMETTYYKPLLKELNTILKLIEVEIK